MRTWILPGMIGVALSVGAPYQAWAAPEGRGAAHVFETLDANGDGQITREEMSQARAAQVARIDADSDGFVTAEEIERMAAERARKQAERMIERRDTNNDGKLSIEEMGRTDAANARFDRVDRDGDGVITQAEFEAAREARRVRGMQRN